MIRIGRFKIYTFDDIYGWHLTGIGWGATWFLGLSSTKPDEYREAFDKKYQHLWDKVEE